MTTSPSKPEPLQITNPLQASVDLRFCETVRDAINRHPNRRAVVKRLKNGLICQVVDYSKPIRAEKHSLTIDPNLIIGWEPIEGHP